MIIGIDLRCLPADGSAGAGVAHAARFLMEELLKRDVPWKWELYKLPGASGSALRRALRERPCDILFVPGGSVAPFPSVPAIPWVHDLAIFDHPEWFPQSRLRRWITTALFRHGIKKSPFVFAVSEETKMQIVRKFHIVPEKIIVTHEGGDPKLGLYTVHRLPTIVSPFILALGTIEPRKNLSMLLNAWKLALPSLPQDLELVIVGRNGWKCEEIVREISTTPRVRRVVDCDDEQRRELLRTAALVVVPSLYEGFGLVALEAMQAGTPLIASKAGSLPEVVGNGGMLRDPMDVNEWAVAIKNVMTNDDERQRLIESGSARAKDFSWEKTAGIVTHGFLGYKKNAFQRSS